MISPKNIFPLSKKKITWDLRVMKKEEGIRSLSVLKLNVISRRLSPKKKKKHQKLNNKYIVTREVTTVYWKRYKSFWVNWPARALCVKTTPRLL